MIKKIKKGVANLFADRAGKWSKVDDYLIIGMIIISTVEIILSTFPGFSAGFKSFLSGVNIFTIVFFTIEVSLRIWTAGEVDPTYKGWKGKIKYCFSFWGMIDIISTYPYYLTFITPIPLSVVTVLRVLRIFRIFRYVEAFDILIAAAKSKRQEMWVSLQFLFLITIILSIAMYYVEYSAQPESCSSGIVSIIWAFMQYVGDPGHFSEFEPITFLGRSIATIIGVLGIAIFAVPAGLIGSAFIEVIDERNNRVQIEENIKLIIAAFRPRLCRVTKYYNIPRYITVKNIQSSTGLSENEILSAVSESDELRIGNLANTFSFTDNPQDTLIVSYAPINRSYGSFINRNSSITIVSTSAVSEISIGHFTYNLAKIGGFNYVSKEIEFDRATPNSYYNIGLAQKDKCPNIDEFLSDIRSLAKDNDKSWVIFMISSSGQDDPHFESDLHFCFGSQVGNSTLEGQKLTLSDTASFSEMYNELSKELLENYNHASCRHDHYAVGTKNVCWKFHNEESDINTFAIRISYSTTCWDIKALEIATKMAESFNKHFESQKSKELDISDMKKRTYGFDL